MAQIDTSIYGRFAPTVKLQTPFEIEDGYQQIQQGQNQNKLAQMQFQKAERDQAQENMLAGITKQHGKDPEAYRNALYDGGFHAQAQAQEKYQTEKRKGTADAEKANVEKQLKIFEVMGQIFGSVGDQASYERGLQSASQVLGPEAVANMPREYNPALVEQKRAEATSEEEKLKYKWKELDYGLKAANEPFKADGSPNTAVQNYGIQKATAGAQQGYTAPVAGVGPDGKPVFFQPSKGGGAASIVPGITPLNADKAQNITEGERKAATLLRRLDFSEKQLQSALTDNKGAAKPGLLQNGLRAMGAEAAANTLTGSERQRVESAQLDILDAALTLGTGAAYTKEQLMGYRQSYFPQLGDGPGQIKDKAARLKNVIEAAKIAAGRAAPNESSTVTPPAAANPKFPGFSIVK